MAGARAASAVGALTWLPVVAVVSALGALYLSYYADVAAGAAVAGSTVGVYLVLALVRLRPRRLSASPR